MSIFAPTLPTNFISINAFDSREILWTSETDRPRLRWLKYKILGASFFRTINAHKSKLCDTDNSRSAVLILEIPYD